MDFLTSEIILYVLIAFAVLIIILLVWNFNLSSKLKRLTRNEKGVSLEKSLFSLHDDIGDLQQFRKELENYLKKVEGRLKKSVQGIESINYNAFAGAESGGKSFAIAFLNENGDGVIISSLHARDRVSVFSKKISKYESDVELSEEEKLALTKAKESCSL